MRDDFGNLFPKDVVPSEDYTRACRKLIEQFKVARSIIDVDVDAFMERYRLHCPAARRRLVEVGIPATLEFGDSSAGRGESRVAVAETVQSFITAMVMRANPFALLVPCLIAQRCEQDSVKLGLVAVDQLQPLLDAVLTSLAKVSVVADLSEMRQCIVNWLATLSCMKAADELSEEQQRQVLFDLERSYNEFGRHLRDGD